MTEILLMLIILLLIAAVWIYNRLVRNRNRVNEAWAGIDVQLQKRSELVPNLVQTVKGYSNHESSVLEQLTRIRSQKETREDHGRRCRTHRAGLLAEPGLRWPASRTLAGERENTGRRISGLLRAETQRVGFP